MWLGCSCMWERTWRLGANLLSTQMRDSTGSTSATNLYMSQLAKRGATALASSRSSKKVGAGHFLSARSKPSIAEQYALPATYACSGVRILHRLASPLPPPPTPLLFPCVGMLACCTTCQGPVASSNHSAHSTFPGIVPSSSICAVHHGPRAKVFGDARGFSFWFLFGFLLLSGKCPSSPCLGAFPSVITSPGVKRWRNSFEMFHPLL